MVDGWMCIGTIGMIFTFFSTCLSKAEVCANIDEGVTIKVATVFVLVHIAAIFTLPRMKASPVFDRCWGRVVQGVVFLACLFITAVPSSLIVKNVTNVWPLVGVIVWALGVEMALDSKTGGNIFNLSLGVAFSVGLTISSTTNHKFLGIIVSFVIPILFTSLYQFIIPTTYNSPQVSLLVLNKDGMINEGQPYYFRRVLNNEKVTNELGVIQVNARVGQQMMLYELKESPDRTGYVHKKFRLTEFQNLSAWEVVQLLIRTRTLE